MERSGNPFTKAPNAPSWLKWGHELQHPKQGCVAVFRRGSPTSWEGRVALYVGPGQAGMRRSSAATSGNVVTFADYPASQVLGYRWPTTGGNLAHIQGAGGGTIGDALTIFGVVGLAAPELLAIGTDLQSLGFTAAGIIVSIAARLVTMFARYSDWQTKGG
jgi:hypothetical protein